MCGHDTPLILSLYFKRHFKITPLSFYAYDEPLICEIILNVNIRLRYRHQIFFNRSVYFSIATPVIYKVNERNRALIARHTCNTKVGQSLYL